MFGRRRGSVVVVGLGNPGPGYARTRHNAGAMLVEELAQRLGAPLKRGRAQARTAVGDLDGVEVLLAVPTTFMNVSGPPVAKLVRKAGARPDGLIVAHDDLDLAPGAVRMKAGGGTGGHRGLDSICSSIRSKDFLRLRLGIGRPPTGVDPAEFVLQRFPPDERDTLASAIDRGIEGLRVYLTKDLDAAQNLLHRPA